MGVNFKVYMFCCTSDPNTVGRILRTTRGSFQESFLANYLDMPACSTSSAYSEIFVLQDETSRPSFLASIFTPGPACVIF